MLFPSGLDDFLDEIAVLYNQDRKNQTAIDFISKKYGIYGLDPVQWEDLGCFTNISIQLTSSISILIAIIFFHSIIF